MAAQSRRRGAVRKPGSKKGPVVGSGGQGRKSLQGKGPTPKAQDRPHHPAHKRKKAAERSGGPGRPRSNQGAGTDKEIISGRNAVVEALRAEVPAATLYLATGLDGDDRTREIRQVIAERLIPVLEVSRTELDQITGGSAHQGVAIQVPPYTYAEPMDLLGAETPGPPLLVALDGITDPRNLGAALRSAGAFAADGVIVPQRRAAGVTTAAWKVSAGAAARVPVARATNLVRALEDLKAAGCFVVGLDGSAEHAVGELPVATEPLVLVLGSEGKGLSRLVRERCDLLASIPIASAVESLNAGTALGIALYEVARQRSR